MNSETGPDSCRSWVIAMAGFVINFLLSGVSRSTGLFYVALIENYGISRMEANLPFTLRTIVRNILGPLVGVIGQHYGARGITIAGGLFAAVGIALCSYASDILWITLLWGGIHGIGVGLGNTLFQITVNQYFEKYRATASGVAFSGACVGTFVFPILFEYLLSDIGLDGTFLLTGGLMLHVIPAGMLMREPPWIKKKSKIKNSECDSFEKDDKFLSRTSTVCNEKIEKTQDIYTISFKRIPSTHDVFSSKHKNEMDKYDSNAKNEFCNNDFQKKTVSKIPVGKLTNGDTTILSSQRFLSVYHDIIRMICEPMFHVISLSLASLVILFDMGFTVIIDYAKDKGIPEETGKYYIIIVSVGDFVGRLGLGWVTDRNYLSLSKYMMLLQITQGCSFALIPFFYSFDSLMILIVVCGIASGAVIIMFPILVSHYLSSVQSLAIGFTCFIGGIISFGVPPMIGYFRDTLGSYDGFFLIVGAFTVLTGFLWGFESLILKMKCKTVNEHESDSTQMSLPEEKI